MIVIKNRQRRIKIDVDFLEQEIIKMLQSLSYADFDLGILLTTNKTVRIYNKTYRKKDKVIRDH